MANEREGELLRLDVGDGKYTVIQPRDAQVRVERYGEDWIGPGFPGCNCVLAMAYELDELRQARQPLTGKDVVEWVNRAVDLGELQEVAFAIGARVKGFTARAEEVGGTA